MSTTPDSSDDRGARQRIDDVVTALPALAELEWKPFAAALESGGMPPVPQEFSVVPAGQRIGRPLLDEILDFIRTFDAVTNRPAWRRRMLADGDRSRVDWPETCFFSAWDFHVPPSDPRAWKLIEFNDNGSGFLYSALMNRCFYDAARLARVRSVEPPPAMASFEQQIVAMIATEAEGFFGSVPDGMYFILDDPESLREGKFRHEHVLLRELLRRAGLECEIGSADALTWSNGALRLSSHPVRFVVNRSTDFSWKSAAFEALRAAFLDRQVYVAPNPFTFATRSDKRLLSFLSHRDWDAELGIDTAERATIGAHVPETLIVDAANVETLVERKSELVFKPARGFAGRGLLASDVTGRGRLRRLLRKQVPYVAQKKVGKFVIPAPGGPDQRLWADVRIWAYRGRLWQLAGRASTRPDRLDLTSPGGWLPTYRGDQAGAR